MKKVIVVNRVFFRTSYFILFLYIGVCIGMYLGQRSLLYVPSGEMGNPKDYGLDFIERTFTTDDGVQLIAWYKPPKTIKSPFIIYFHGNAKNLSTRATKLKNLASKDAGVLALSYRGYGSSEGSPSEENLYKDARMMMKFANQKSSNIYLYGESLGTGVATQMATEYNVKKLILEAPFTSVGDRAQEIYPWIPVKLLLIDKFDNMSKIKKIGTSLLIIHSADDNVTPITHGKALFAAASEPKESLFINGHGHGINLTPEILDKIFK
jgi:fermentation-respiration switch protein FrsA (DUF1100 family)